MKVTAANIVRRVNFHSVLAMAGMAGPIVLAATDLSVGIAQPGYSPIKDSISSLALTHLGWVQTIGFLAIGLLVEIFVAGLLFNVRPARGFHLGIGLLVVFGFCLLLIGAFRTDPVGTDPHTTEGAIHTFVASGVFWLFPLALAFMAPSLRQDTHWHNIYVYTLAACVIDVVLVVAMGIFGDTVGWFGLMERLTVANMIIWVEVAAIKMLRLSLKRRYDANFFGFYPAPLIAPLLFLTLPVSSSIINTGKKSPIKENV